MNIKEHFDFDKPDKIASFALLAQAAPQIVWFLLIVSTIGLVAALCWLWAWLNFIAMMVSMVVLILSAWKIVDSKVHSIIALRRSRLLLIKEQAQVEALWIKNERERARADLERLILPQIVEKAILSGHNFTYNPKGEMTITDWRSNVTAFNGVHQLPEISESAIQALPTYIRYEEIKHQIPQGHNLVGIGPNGLITKEDRHIGACVWIIGGSGSGKTSTTSLRLEERAACGHQFYGVDPHWFKDDSLTNAVVGFSDKFLVPMARDTKETSHVFKSFLKEFQDRKAGRVAKPFQKITLVVDELGSFNDPQNEEEEENLKTLKTIVRITGQESRNFEMGGMYISQQATGLYWVGNVALLIIVHKLLKENQQKLATQADDKKLFTEMRLWPKGRTYVYGMGLEEGEGCLVLQQPYFEKPAVGSWNFEEVSIVEEVPETSDLDIVYEACQSIREKGQSVTVRAVEAIVPFKKTKVSELMARLREQGCEIS